MARITIICAVFPPQMEPAGIMAAQLATALVADRHEVTAIVPSGNRSGKEADWRARCREVDAGCNFKIVRCPSWTIGRRRRGSSRIIENFVFGITSAWALSRHGRSDLLIVETWPLFAVQTALLVARWQHTAAIYYVQDVYPEAAENTGIIARDGRVARACRFWDRSLCAASNLIVAVSEQMRELLISTRGIPSRQVVTIANWVDPAEFPLYPVENKWRAEQDLPNSTFVVMYAGTLGMVSGIAVLVETARLLQKNANILLCCVGEGSAKEMMMRDSRLLGIENLRFFPFQPRHRVAEVLAAANAVLLTMSPSASDASVPSKLVSYLAAARAIICAAPRKTTAAQVVADAAGGIVLEPGDPAKLAGAIEHLANRRDEAERMGRNARRYFEDHFTFERAYAKFSAAIRNL